MAAFPREVELDGGADRAFRLVQNGFVTKFHRPAVLDESVRWLTENGYHVVSVDAAGWQDARDMLRALGHALSFPDYYGRNLDAFNDCLGDVAALEYGTDDNATGTVLVLLHYDAILAKEPHAAQVVLECFAEAARRAALFGHRMLCLVQSDDPELSIKPVGSTAVGWNAAEASTSSRLSDRPG